MEKQGSECNTKPGQKKSMGVVKRIERGFFNPENNVMPKASFSVLEAGPFGSVGMVCRGGRVGTHDMSKY